MVIRIMMEYVWFFVSPPKVMLKSGCSSSASTSKAAVLIKSPSPSSSSSSPAKSESLEDREEEEGDDDDKNSEDREDDQEDDDSIVDHDRSPSPAVPEGQYEVEKVVDYVRDETGEMYFVKWKNWEEEFNTWEPPQNLVNCDGALLEFYLARKAEYDRLISQSEYVITEGGKKRRKGPKIEIQVPPDPRPVDVQVQEFFAMHGALTDEEISVRQSSYSEHLSMN